MFPDLNGLLQWNAFSAANSLLEKALAGDVSTIALIGIAAIVLFVAIVLLVELAAWMVNLVKRLLLFVIVAVSACLFFFSFQSKIFSPEPNIALLAMGIIGTGFAILALAISFFSLKREWQKPKEQKIAELKSEMKKLVAEQFESKPESNSEKVAVAWAGAMQAMPGITAAQAQKSSMLSGQALPVSKQAQARAGFFSSFNDRSLLAMLSYLAVVEFGLICGTAFAAPSIELGLIFSALFLVAALVFVKSTYHSPFAGLKRLFLALAIGCALSIALSNIWLSIPLETLFFPAFFQASALVALVAGLAVILLMGSEN